MRTIEKHANSAEAYQNFLEFLKNLTFIPPDPELGKKMWKAMTDVSEKVTKQISKELVERVKKMELLENNILAREKEIEKVRREKYELEESLQIYRKKLAEAEEREKKADLARKNEERIRNSEGAGKIQPGCSPPPPPPSRIILLHPALKPSSSPLPDAHCGQTPEPYGARARSGEVENCKPGKQGVSASGPGEGIRPFCPDGRAGGVQGLTCQHDWLP